MQVETSRQVSVYDKLPGAYGAVCLIKSSPGIACIWIGAQACSQETLEVEIAQMQAGLADFSLESRGGRSFLACF